MPRAIVDRHDDISLINVHVIDLPVDPTHIFYGIRNRKEKNTSPVQEWGGGWNGGVGRGRKTDEEETEEMERVSKNQDMERRHMCRDTSAPL